MSLVTRGGKEAERGLQRERKEGTKIPSVCFPSKQNRRASLSSSEETEGTKEIIIVNNSSGGRGGGDEGEKFHGKKKQINNIV